MFLKATMYNFNSLWSSLIVSFTLLTLLFLRIAQCHYSHYDQYLDPCKASGYLGDIAMSDEEFRDITKRAVLELLLKSGNDSDSIHDLQVEDPFTHTGGPRVDKINNDDKSQLKELEDDMKLLKKTLHTKRAELKRKCQLKTKKECTNFRSDLKENIRETRDKLKQLKNQLNKLQKKRSVKGDNQEMSLLALKKHSQVKKGKQGDKKKTTKKSAKSRARRAATAKKERLWDYGVIPFVIESNFSAANKALFQLAMRHWENYTCITFKDRDPEDENFIVFTERSCGCCSFVGKRGNGPQGISIGKNCDKFGIVVHELGHAVGFWHEHTRPDRDQHVQILYKNVMQGQDYNFKKLTPADVNSLGETYDYGSIMHYARNTFGRSTYLDTILPIRKPGVAVRPEIGQRVRLSPGDIRQANRLYNCPTCGKTLQESSDKFSHVPKPGQTEICQWRISATHGEKIVLNITKLDIPKSYSCESDYLEVRDGHYIKSPLLGRFCGDTVPETLTSGTRMWIEYRTRSGSGTGFEAQYEAICGGDIVKDEGFLSSPNYPEDYRPQKVCVWKITVSEGLSVALKFQSFEIENHDDCVYDYLEVRDGQSESSPLIGKYCGYRTPDDIRSTGRHLYVKFVSDGSVQKAGFFARFVKELDECEIYDHGCDHNCINTLGSYRCECKIGYELHSDGRRCEKACGGYIYAENGTITSPSYPEPYPPNKQCVWKIVAPNDHKINLNFTHFDIEGHNQGCEFDSLSVDSGDTGSNKIHEVFCGSIIPAPVTSEHNTLRIEFKSDNSVQKSGFTATFMTDKDECIVNNGGCQHVCKNTIGSYHCACHSGFTLHQDMHGCKEGGCQFDIKALNGTIASPNYPEYYPSKSDCVWKFSTVLGHRIRLTFKSFEVEPHQECTYDHVIVFDGDDRNAPKLGIFCGAVLPDPVISTGDTMFMLFFSDASVQRKGFEAEHDSVCGASLEATATPQVIVSHAAFGDHNYRNKEECDWLIESKDGQNILITFTAFSLESENECRYDYLVIYEGPKDTDGTHKKLCHSELPEPIITKSPHVLVRFRSDDTISRKGFSFTFQKHQPGQESREDEDEDLDFQWWSDVQGSSSNTS